MDLGAREERAKSIEEAVSFAIAHRTRIEILAVLNEGACSPSELARLLKQPVTRINNHIKELRKSGSIELARVEKVRNTDQHFYRAVEIPFLSDEATRALDPNVRQEITGIILQAIMAESMSSFWAGKMLTDDDIWLSWRWFNLDAQGRREVADEQAAFWKRIAEIESESSARRLESGEEPRSIVVVEMGFERSRQAAWTADSPKANCD